MLFIYSCDICSLVLAALELDDVALQEIRRPIPIQAAPIQKCETPQSEVSKDCSEKTSSSKMAKSACVFSYSTKINVFVLALYSVGVFSF